ncbi:hypothetical protein S83_039240, partial [Arachis hypogaea]
MRMYEFPSKWNPREIYNMKLVLQDEWGDRIHYSIPKSNMVVFRTLFISYEKIEAMVGVNKNNLLDCMGHVVGRKDVTPLVTKSEDERKCIKLHLEDLEKNSMKCTLFGDLVDKALGLFDKDNGQSIILVAQLFKSSFYLNEVNVQNSLYAFRLFFNSQDLDVLVFKNRLIKRGDIKAQRINYIQSQPINSVSDELSGDSLPITTIEEVLNKTNETSCWIQATVVFIEVNGSDCYYALCKSCPRKVKENKGRYLCEHCGKISFNVPLRYRLHVIATNGTGYIGLIIWNQEAKLVVGKSASEVKDLSVRVDQGVSNLLPASFTNEAKFDVHSATVVSLSK